MAIYGVQSTENYYRALSSGQRINSVADDAAGLAISEKLLSQSNGYDKGTQNALDAKNLLSTAEGGLSNISDSLQRMRELALQASNSFYTDSDKRYIQNEINQLKDGIADSVNNTSFNGKNLLDGSTKNFHFAVAPDGSGYDVSLGNRVLESLGISDFDVTKNFNIGDIDSALDIVNSLRSDIGAYSNALDYTISENHITALNLMASRSGIVDADMAQFASDMKREEVLNYYNLFMRKKSQENSRNITMKLLNSL